jgi:hypothetical protein
MDHYSSLRPLRKLRSSSGPGDLGGEVELSSLSLALVNDAGLPGD